MEECVPVLELVSLKERHPEIGEILLDEFGAHAILRLGLDPLPQPAGISKRGLIIDWIKKGSGGNSGEVFREIGWSGLPKFDRAYLLRLLKTRNEEDITCGAAIGVMALLIHDLEEMRIQSVLPIGSGGDYLICRAGSSEAVQIEVSGIRVANYPSDVTGRIEKRRD